MIFLATRQELNVDWVKIRKIRRYQIPDSVYLLGSLATSSNIDERPIFDQVIIIL